MHTTPVIAVVVGLLVLSAPAKAQVTTNDGALDSLSTPRAPAQRPARPAPRPSANPASQATPSKPAAPAPAPASAPPRAVRPEIPATPPAILALPPPVAVPLTSPAAAPTVPLADDAPGTASAIPGGLRVTFGADRWDLNPATVATLTKFAGTLAEPNTPSVTLFAYAAGSPDDPSTPRRLSLQRALAARAVLLQAGIASPRIYPRAMGPAEGADPDRVDVMSGSTPPPGGHPG